MLAPVYGLLGLVVAGTAATVGARTLKKKNVSESEKLQRLRQQQKRNAQIRSLTAALGPNATALLNPVDAWRLQTGGVIDISKLPQEAQDAFRDATASNQATSDALRNQGSNLQRQTNDESAGSEALAMLDSLDRRFGTYLKNYLKGRMGNLPWGAATGEAVSPRVVNDAWAFKSYPNITRGSKGASDLNPGMPTDRVFMQPIWFRRYALQALADGVDPDGKSDLLGQDVVIDDATAEILGDFSAWIATFSPSQGEVSMLVKAKHAPSTPGFWDRIWNGITSTFKEVLSLDFLVNVASLGYVNLTAQDRTDAKGKLITAQEQIEAAQKPIKDKINSMPGQMFGWVGAGIDASQGSKATSPNLRPMTPEEKRIAEWLTAQYVTVPHPDAPQTDPNQYPWVIRLDLAMCGLWPILDVIQWWGGVEGFERSLMLATAPNGENVVGGSRELYQKPGQLAMRALMIARRSLAGVEDRYSYGAATVLSVLNSRPDAAPTRAFLESIANGWIAGKSFTERARSQQSGINNQAEGSGSVWGDQSGGSGSGQQQNQQINSQNPQDATVRYMEWQYGGANGPKVALPAKNASTIYGLWQSITTANKRLNSQAIAANFGLGGLRLGQTPYIPKSYQRWGIAGPVPISGKNWVSNETINNIRSQMDQLGSGALETFSLTPQGRDDLKARGY